MQREEHEQCIECGGRIIENQGMFVCKDCGLEHSQKLESSYQLGGEKPTGTHFKETQYTGIDNRISRVNSLGSSIGRTNEQFFRDVEKKPLDSKQQAKYNKLKTFYHIPASLKGKETDYRTLKILEEVLVRLELEKKTQDRARFLYKEYKEKYKGKISNAVLLSAVCVFQAIRENKCPTTLKELVTTYQELKHRVYGKTIVKLMDKLGLKTTFQRSEGYISQICSELCKSPVIIDRLLSKYEINVRVYENILRLLSYRLLENISIKDRGGRRPRPLAASIVYVVDKRFAKLMLKGGSALTQKLTAKYTGVAEFTIREHSEFALKYCTDDLYADIRTHLGMAKGLKPLSQTANQKELINSVCEFFSIQAKTKNRTLFLLENYSEVYREDITDSILLSALCLLFALREHKCNILPIEIITAYKIMGKSISETQLVEMLTELELKEVETIFLESEDHITTVCSLISSSIKVRARVLNKYNMNIQAYKTLLLITSDRVLQKIPASKRKQYPPYTFTVAVFYTVDKYFAQHIRKSSVLTYEIIEDTTRITQSEISKLVDFVSSFITKDIFKIFKDSFST